jgi:Glucodextranase, domain B/PASTA domain
VARRRPVAEPLVAAAALCALAGGCGGDSPAAAPVRVQVTAPRDEAVVRKSQVELRGTVRPATATVMVDGHRADVSGGEFRATVGLAPGTNVVDVIASAGDARPALTAIRIRRRVTVDVPDVTGLVAADASARLEALGLTTEVDDQDGLFERLLPGRPKVCATKPDRGATVEPGTTVRLLVSKQC